MQANSPVSQEIGLFTLNCVFTYFLYLFQYHTKKEGLISRKIRPSVLCYNIKLTVDNCHSAF